MRQPELPRVSANKVEVAPQSKAETREFDMQKTPIMPRDGPKTVKSKLGSAKVQSIKILKPTKDKKIAATRQFEKPKYLDQ